MTLNLSLVYAAMSLLAAVLAAYVVRWMFMERLERLLTEFGMDSGVVQAISDAVPLWGVVIGAYAALSFVSVPPVTSNLIGTALFVVAVLVTTWVTGKVATGITIRYGNRIGAAHGFGSMAQNIAKFAVIVIGLAVLLSGLGVHVTPIIASLGIGALAVALALQDTLSNIFAGLYILADQPVRVGDFIKLQTGEEGVVLDIGWRSTKIKTLTNYVVIISNKKLSESTIHNYHLPEKSFLLNIPVSVSYEADPGKVTKILIDEVRRVAKEMPQMVEEFEPQARLIPGFGEYSLNFTLTCKVQQYTDQFPVADELRKRILERFKREGIEIPFPARTVYLEGSQANK